MQQGKPGTPIVYEAFDLLELEGQPLVDLPLVERRARLERLLDRRKQTTVRLSETFEDGQALYEAAQEQGLEGVIAKRADSPYRQGKRTREWLKVKTHGRQEFVIAGYTKGQGRRAGRLGSLVLGVWRGKELSYVGNCGTGFTDKDIDDLIARLRPLERPASPFRTVPAMPKVRKADVVWVEPELVCEVEFAEWTHDGRLRAPSFQGLREDKPSREVHREEAAPIGEELRVGRRVLRLSNLDKVFWPEEGITKGDLLAYYRAVAPVLLPHLRNRPFTLKRYPDGIAGGHFFQKDAPTHMPEWIPTREFEVSTRESPRRRRKIRVPLVNDELALLWMVNMGCIDLNTWYSRVDKPHRPDFVLFDLDPADDAGFRRGRPGRAPRQGGARRARARRLPQDERQRRHSRSRAGRAAGTRTTRRGSSPRSSPARWRATHRGLVTTEWTKSKRRGVLIDANQNGEGKTIASVYSVRPRPGAPVSTPLRWDEVREGLDPLAFTDGRRCSPASSGTATSSRACSPLDSVSGRP